MATDLKVGDRVRHRASYVNWLGNVTHLTPQFPFPIRVTWEKSTNQPMSWSGVHLASELSKVG